MELTARCNNLIAHTLQLIACVRGWRMKNAAAAFSFRRHALKRAFLSIHLSLSLQ
jgi:hypothetical protein